MLVAHLITVIEVWDVTNNNNYIRMSTLTVRDWAALCWVGHESVLTLLKFWRSTGVLKVQQALAKQEADKTIVQ